MPPAATSGRILARVTTALAMIAASMAAVPLNAVPAQAETSVSVGTEPRDIAMSPDGRYAYTVQRASGTLTRIDLSAVSSQVFLSGLGQPRSVAVTADDSRIIVGVGNRLHLIDPSNPTTDDSRTLPTNSIDSIVTVGDYAFAIDHEGLELYRLAKTAGTWSSANWTQIWTGVTGHISRFMAVAPDASSLIIAIESGGANTLYILDDPTTCTPCSPTGVSGSPGALGVAYSPDSTYAYVAVGNTFKRVNPTTRTLSDLDSSVSGTRARDVGFTSDGNFAYVAYQYNSGTGPRIQKIRTSTGVAEQTVTLSPGAEPYAVTTSPTAGVDLAVIVGAVSNKAYFFPSVANAPSNLTATAGDDTASISFTPGQDGLSPITNYEYSLDGTTWTALSPADTASPVTIPGLPNGVAQSISLRAINAIGEGSPSSTVSVTPVGPPDPPTVTRVDWDDTTASIYFTAPAFDGGTPITTYEYSLDSGANWNNRADGGGTASPLVVTGLTTNTTYAIDLRAVNGVGGGTTPAAPVVVTPGAPKTPDTPPPTFPAGPPTAVTATAGDRSAVVTWQEPTDAGSFSITHYQVVSEPGRHTCLTTTTTCVIDGLTSEIGYTFTVRALNGAGWGATSEPSAALVWPDEQTTSILVTGGRTTGNRIAFTGTLTGMPSDSPPPTIRPMMTFTGERSPTMGRAVAPTEDGSFTWGRRLSRAATIWFVAGETSSTPITVDAIRRGPRT